nr:hypothetical protein [Oscillospiraceae bacterium]
MKLDFYHNKIVADTVTSEFENGFRSELLPILEEKYGALLEIQMYEDYISDELTVDGYWYYPLTLLIASGPVTQWVRWPLNKLDFEDGVPYSFTGRGKVGFELCDAPAGFEEKLSGRARYASEGSVKVRVEIVGGDPVRLSGKYSQTFIDEMARQLTSAIESATGVTGIADSSVELVMVFAPGTYMEHTSENLTYRRLMLLDKVSAPRDFWIQWTRLDGAVAHSVSSHVNGDNILFELGEDVDQKIREKEYRYLLSSGKDKYHNSMGRKKVTEWREVIKRAAKRGELSKVETDFELAPETLELEERIADLLGKKPAERGGYEKEEIPFISAEDDEFERAMEKVRMVVERGADDSESEPVSFFEMIAETEEETDESHSETAKTKEDICEDVAEESFDYEETDIELEALDLAEETDEDTLAEMRALEPDEDVLEIYEPEDALSEDSEEADETEEDEDEPSDEVAERLAIPEEELLPDEEMQSIDEILAVLNEVSLGETDDISGEEASIEETAQEDDDEIYSTEPVANEAPIIEETAIESPVALQEEKTAEIRPAHTTIADRVADIRAELETKIRLEYESRARIKAEQELVALRREQQKLKLENEAIAAEAKKEQERLRREYELLLEQTERAAAQREAEEAQRRAEEEQLRAQIEMQLRAEARERERLAEAARMAIEEQHRLEAENARIARQREEEERIEAENRRREEEQRQLEALRQAELERIRREDEEAKARARNAMPDMGDGRYAYTSKSVKLLFRKSVDPNITTRIYEIMKATVEYYGKDRVYLKIKATVADSQTVVLDFEHIPIEEMELLGNIIKILGNSGLGIAKAIIE